ncbi:MAG: hypothetical protein HC897_15900, partial [Thermoanaerobaculia bacterium]|nr:hypothetical protein [Thermoanaerobaculia bacterium]
MNDDMDDRQIPTHIELAYSAIRIFANDGTLDMEELNFLLGLALKDNVINDDERRVLRNIFKQAEETRLSPAVAARIREAR